MCVTATFWSSFKGEVDAKTIVEDVVKHKTQKPRDLVVLMDTSGSISDSEFSKTLQNVNTLMTHLCPGPGDIGFNNNQYVVALALFDTEFHLVFDFSESFNLATVSRKISSIKRKWNGLTYTATALKKVREELLESPSSGVRPHVISDKVVLVITDGSSNGPLNLVQESELLGKLAQVFAIGIGANNKAELAVMTNGDKGHTFHYTQWDDFHHMVSEVERITSAFKSVDCAPIVRK